MTTTDTHPSLREVYTHAQTETAPVPDDAALDSAAHAHGYESWAAFEAVAGVSYLTFGAGTRVEGRYLGHSFTGTIKGANSHGLRHTRLSVAFDTPLDVSAFKAFSVLRQRVSATVDRFGDSEAKTSDGVPQMQLWRLAD
ncbi:glyoxalase superfamily protein [Kordiimonas marina]|uniref:glyoxalase superfamily protein n=1 Tax=Kordiimonas marina TaxID=2872312 RepID=UPI001FF1D6AB|nr:glyoxalase superfamily protein [Kordiimonas marina]MCJ9427515.1 hypothetical protein [Kordiimonas marina]